MAWILANRVYVGHVLGCMLWFVFLDGPTHVYLYAVCSRAAFDGKCMSHIPCKWLMLRCNQVFGTFKDTTFQHLGQFEWVWRLVHRCALRGWEYTLPVHTNIDTCGSWGIMLFQVKSADEISVFLDSKLHETGPAWFLFWMWLTMVIGNSACLPTLTVQANSGVSWPPQCLCIIVGMTLEWFALLMLLLIDGVGRSTLNLSPSKIVAIRLSHATKCSGITKHSKHSKHLIATYSNSISPASCWRWRRNDDSGRVSTIPRGAWVQSPCEKAVAGICSYSVLYCIHLYSYCIHTVFSFLKSYVNLREVYLVYPETLMTEVVS